jgi:uncharacterized protein YdgA (DUF945 family)
MRMRSGYVFIVIVLAFVTAAATPFINGYFFQDSYLNLITALNVGHPFQLHVIDYKRGWLSSDARLELIFTPPPAMKIDADKVGRISDALKKVTITQHITHGPFVKYLPENIWHFSRALINTTLHIEKSAEDFLLGAKASGGIVQIQTYVTYHNLYKNSFQIPAIAIKNNEKAELLWTGAKGTLDATIANNFITELKSNFTWGDSNLHDKTSTFSSLPTTLALNINCASPDALCIANNKFSLPGMASNDPDATFKLTDFTINLNESLTNRNSYNSDLIILLNRYESPSFTLSPLSVKISIKNVNADVLTKLKSQYNDAKNSILQGNDYKSEYLVFLAQVNLALPGIIKPTSSIAEEINVKTSYGDISSNAKLSWPDNTPLPKSSAELGKASMELNIRVAATLVNEWLKKSDEYAGAKTAKSTQPLQNLLVDKMISNKNLSPDVSNIKTDNLPRKDKMQFDELVAKGFIKHDQDDYTISITYENTVLKVNGIVIPLKNHHEDN